MTTIVLHLTSYRTLRDGVLFTLASLTAVAGYFGPEITWLIAGS